MRRRAGRRLTVALVLPGLAVGSACIQENATPDALTGPSELGLSLTLSARPDVLELDGVSESLIEIWARDAEGVSVPDQAIRLQIQTPAGFQDLGQLSARQVVTDTNGRASATYTVPASPVSPLGAEDTGQIVTILATPIDADYSNAIVRSLDIRLVPPGTIILPFDITVGFEYVPESPAAFANVLFTTTCTGETETDCVRDPNGLVESYRWSFGDGDTAIGPTASHTFDQAGIYHVALTVTDRHGRSEPATRAVQVAGGTPPTAVFVVSPIGPLVGDPVFVNASGSTAAAGRRLVSYHWDFGDGGQAAGVTASHEYSVEGSFVVTLVVTDDRGQTGTASEDVFVGGVIPTPFTPPIADFIVSPANPGVGDTVSVNASASLPATGRQIVSYQWDFGDGTQAAGVTASHQYTRADSYVVTLVVTDDEGQADTTTELLTVL